MALPLNKFRLLTTNLISGSNTIYQENIDVATIILSCQITNITGSSQTCDVAIQKSGSASQIVLLKNGTMKTENHYKNNYQLNEDNSAALVRLVKKRATGKILIERHLIQRFKLSGGYTEAGCHSVRHDDHFHVEF